MAAVYGSRQRPRGRRGRRLLISLIVLLLVVGGLLVVADRFGASYAERLIADRVAEEVAKQRATSREPEVTIGGVPFLTQVAAGDYREIRIELCDFAGPVDNGRTIRMPLLDVRATGVRAPLETLRTRRGDITASAVTGTGTVDYATLATLTGREGVRLGEKDGKLAVTAPVEVLNQTVTVNGTANLTVAEGNVVRMRFETLAAEGLPNVPLVQSLLNNYARRLSTDIAVPALPLKLVVRSVRPTADGLVVTAGATDVPLNGGLR